MKAVPPACVRRTGRHRHVVFSIPKILRRYFLYDRKLLSDPTASPILGPNGYDTVSVRIGGNSEVRRGRQCGQVSVVVDGLRLGDLRLGKEALKAFYTTGVRDPKAVPGAVVAI